MDYPSHVQLTEVGMRDGFQMENRILSTDVKVEIGLALIDAGVKHLEATSFVSPAAVPQLADAAQLVCRLKERGAELSALVPNLHGARRAVSSGIDRMTVFVSASETHNKSNVRRAIAESLAALPEVGCIASEAAIPLSGVVATAFGCPYEGNVTPEAVLRVVRAFVEMGAETVSLGDTTGMATPPIVQAVVRRIQQSYPQLPVALHFHNTRGLGLVNVLTGLQLGIDRFESAIGGLGGCPFAVGATGNVCTEDLVYMLDELGISSGVDLGRLLSAAARVESEFGRSLPGHLLKSGPRLARHTAPSE